VRRLERQKTLVRESKTNPYNPTWSPNLRAGVSEIIQTRDGEIRVKPHSKTLAIETLAKHLSMFKDQ
jgi:hypothetical protein